MEVGTAQSNYEDGGGLATDGGSGGVVGGAGAGVGVDGGGGFHSVDYGCQHLDSHWEDESCGK